MEKRKPKKKKETIRVDKDFFLKFVKKTEERFKELDALIKQKEPKVPEVTNETLPGFTVSFLDEESLPGPLRFVRLASFTEDLKEVLKHHKVSKLSGAFELGKKHVNQEKMVEDKGNG